MPSQAITDLKERLEDIEQLMQAHTALTKFRKAEKAAQDSGGALANLTKVVEALVTQPGKGKPAEVGAINRGAFVLLCSHFQGFVDDLHTETAQHTLKGKVSNIADVIKLVRPRNANPRVDVIETMFSGVGVYEIMASVKWAKCSNATVKERLKKYIEERNSIAHGKRPKITKAKVTQFREFVKLLADALEVRAAKGIKSITGQDPW